MLGGKSAGSTKLTALGTLLQAATYGLAIPQIYGMTQSAPLAIWAADLRRGGGGIKKFKQLKKGLTNYEEAIDFLLGHNPIVGVNQMWNNGSPIPLTLTSVTAAAAANITISDPHFFSVIGVTCATTYSETFNDYGGTGAQAVSGTFQTPMWNSLHNGPDPVHNSEYRNFPYVYRWQPGYGAEIFLDGFLGLFDLGEITIWYYQLMDATSYLPPLQKEYLFFEQQLGDGQQYADAGLSDQQIIYPMFAGIGSYTLDLGSSGAMPSYQVEVQGKFGIYSAGDCDFADIIEDVFKSGVAQAAIGATDGSAPGVTAVEHGLSGYQYPGTIQMKCMNSIEAYTVGPIAYNMNVNQGNFLVVVATTSGVGGGALSISDSASNTWTPAFSGSPDQQAWYATANATGPCTVTVTGQAYDWSTVLIEIGGVDTFDTAVTGSAVSTLSITTTNQQEFPEYLIAFELFSFPVGYGPKNPTSTPASWNLLTPANTYDVAPLPGINIQDLVLYTPGTYPLTVSGTTPTSMCILGFKCVNPPSYPDPVGDFIDFASLDQVRLQCRAGGLFGSLCMSNQQAASDWLKTLYQAADAAPVFLGFKLYSFPYSEVSAVGNGAVYIAPTASGPVANLSTENGDFISQGGGTPLIQVQTAARVDQPNVLQMQIIDRTSNYNPAVVEQPDIASISLFGVRKANPVVNNAVQDVAVALQLLGIQVRKLQYGGDIYTFTLPAKWCLLAPMDLITITDPLANFLQIPVRLTSIAEQDDGSFECEAEAFIYGMYSPAVWSATTATAPDPYTPQTGTAAGNVNAPIIFEPVPRLYANASQAQLWIVVSSSSASYGGCQVYVSTDGGSSYTVLGDPIAGSATMGVTTADWPAAADPDTTNNLALNLSESLGTLQSYSTSAEDNFQYPCYVSGGGDPIPYEIMTYAVATLTSTYNYTLMATGSGNELRRGVFGAPSAGVGVDHPSGSNFAFLNPSGQGILKVNMDPTWIGVELYFKIVSFNTFGTAAQSLSDVTAYTYTPTGIPGNIGAAGGFLVNGN